MTSDEISRNNYISRGSVNYRAKKIGIKSIPRVKKYFDKEEVEQILNYKPKKHIIDLRSLRENKIEIIELYLSCKNNSCSQIAKSLNLKYPYVSNVINEWLNNNKIITVA